MCSFIKIECINGQTVYLNTANITAIEGSEEEGHFTIYTNGIYISHKCMYYVVEGSVSRFVTSLNLDINFSIKSLN